MIFNLLEKKENKSFKPKYAKNNFFYTLIKYIYIYGKNQNNSFSLKIGMG